MGVMTGGLQAARYPAGSQAQGLEQRGGDGVVHPSPREPVFGVGKDGSPPLAPLGLALLPTILGALVGP